MCRITDRMSKATTGVDDNRLRHSDTVKKYALHFINTLCCQKKTTSFDKPIIDIVLALKFKVFLQQTTPMHAQFTRT